MQYVPYQIAAGIMLSVYLYDLIIMDGCSSFDCSLIIHHVLTIIAAMLIIIGRYTPFATWYGYAWLLWLFHINWHKHLDVNTVGDIQSLRGNVLNGFVFIG